MQEIERQKSNSKFRIKFGEYDFKEKGTKKSLNEGDVSYPHILFAVPHSEQEFSSKATEAYGKHVIDAAIDVFNNLSQSFPP